MRVKPAANETIASSMASSTAQRSTVASRKMLNQSLFHHRRSYKFASKNTSGSNDLPHRFFHPQRIAWTNTLGCWKHGRTRRRAILHQKSTEDASDELTHCYEFNRWGMLQELHTGLIQNELTTKEQVNQTMQHTQALNCNGFSFSYYPVRVEPSTSEHTASRTETIHSSRFAATSQYMSNRPLFHSRRP